MSMDNVVQATEILAQGMIGIFVVLGIIALLVLFMQKLDKRKK